MRTRGADVPEHYERLPLPAGIRVGLWGGAATLVAGTLLIGTHAQRNAAETFVGAVLAVLAAATVVAAYRFAAFEVTVTRASLRAGFGPFSFAAPLWGMRVGDARPATSWRRFYASLELPVELDDPRGPRTLVLPSAAPDELAAALRSLQPRPDQPSR